MKQWLFFKVNLIHAARTESQAELAASKSKDKGIKLSRSRHPIVLSLPDRPLKYPSSQPQSNVRGGTSVHPIKHLLNAKSLVNVVRRTQVAAFSSPRVPVHPVLLLAVQVRAFHIGQAVTVIIFNQAVSPSRRRRLSPDSVSIWRHLPICLTTPTCLGTHYRSPQSSARESSK